MKAARNVIKHYRSRDSILRRECFRPSSSPSVRPAHRFAVDPSEHVLVADSNHQAAGVDVDGILAVTIRWIDGSHLEVSVPPAARIFQRKTSSGPVSIDYVVP
jgi:hypothetical protein